MLAHEATSSLGDEIQEPRVTGWGMDELWEVGGGSCWGGGRGETDGWHQAGAASSKQKMPPTVEPQWPPQSDYSLNSGRARVCLLVGQRLVG